MIEQQQVAGHAPASETPREEPVGRRRGEIFREAAARMRADAGLPALCPSCHDATVCGDPFHVSRPASETPVEDFDSPEDPQRTLDSLAAMLGWMNTPPRRTLEQSISALKARSLSAASETGQASAWQPIGSAPKDGTPILGCRSTWTHPYVFCYLNGPGLIEGWHDFNISPDGRRPHDLTHWMPLPLAPSEDETTTT